MKIREADPNKDTDAIAHIHIEGWKSAYGGIINQNYLDSLSVSERADKWKIWLADEESSVDIAFVDDKPVGFVSYGRLRTPPPGQSAIRPLYTGEIMALYILPDYWRRGAGTALLKQACVKLKDFKHQSLCLWVLDKNSRACIFYEKMGGTRIGKQFIEVGGTRVKEVCYGWRNTAEIISL